jgi:hypothetical protein
LLLALAGPPFSCPVTPPCFRSVYSERELDGHACRALRFDIEATLTGFERAHLGTVRDVCEMLREVDLWIQPEQTQWPNETLGMVKGRFVWKLHRMEIARDMLALAHETLHAWEWFRTTKSLHELGESPGAWDVNDVYRVMLRRYERRARTLDLTHWSIEFTQ